MRYWIGVIAGDLIPFAVAEGVCAFTKGQEAPVAKLDVGDRFFFYSPKTGVMDGDPVQAFTAMGEVTGDVVYQKPWGDTGFTAWVRDAVTTKVVKMITMLAQMKPPPRPPMIAGTTRTLVFGMNQ